MILKQGNKGSDVTALQRDLAELGYTPGAHDGDYGAKTAAAVLAFQLDYSDVEDDGIAGPQTLARIAQVIAAKRSQPRAGTPTPNPMVACNAATWDAFMRLVDLVTDAPAVRYGPGRGLWSNGRFVITHGPGALGSKSWPSMLGRSYPSFHCTSWTNFVLGWLLRRNELYTHAGNVPSLFDLVTAAPTLHPQPDASPYRGYGDACTRIAADGTGATRSGVPGAIDARELYARRATMPTFVVCGQSSRRAGGWLWWHHTVLYVFRDGKMFRIAADGYRDKAKGYSGATMKWLEITPANVGQLDGAIYRAYGVDPNDDGSYGDKTKPIAAVEVEP